MRQDMADVLVVGAGVVGATIAHEVALRGQTVIVVDAADTVGGGCSYANAGLLSPSHVEPLATPANVSAGLRSLFRPDGPFHIRPRPTLAPWLLRFVKAATPRRAALLTARLREMAAHSLAQHQQYAESGLAVGLERRGSFDVFDTQEALDAAAARLADGPDRVISPDQARDQEPLLGPVAGAISHPGDAHIESRTYVTAMLAAATANGAEVRWGTRGTRLIVEDDRVRGLATTSGGDVRAHHVVIAAGMGSAPLCRSAGIRLPLQGATGYVVDLATTGRVPSRPLTFKERRVVVTPYADRVRLSGTLELGRPAGTPRETRIAPIRAAARAGLPGLEVTEVIEVWTGDRPCAADGVPIIGASRRHRGLVVATGHGMWGLVLAPVTAQWVARGLLEAAPTLHEAAFSPDRFG